MFLGIFNSNLNLGIGVVLNSYSKVNWNILILIWIVVWDESYIFL